MKRLLILFVLLGGVLNEAVAQAVEDGPSAPEGGTTASTDARQAKRLQDPPPTEPSATTEEDQSGFLVAGAGIGSPSGIVLIGGYYFSPCAVRISGGSWGPSWNGWQADLGVNLSRGSLFAQGVSVIGGHWSANPILPDDQGVPLKQVRTQDYIGGAYDMYLSGFFVQVGIVFPQRPAGPAEVTLQLAYLFGIR
jgi:hypothetical protein